MKYILKLKQPFIDLIKSGQKTALVTDKLSVDDFGAFEILDDGLDEEFIKKTKLNPIPESRKGKICLVITCGSARKISKEELYNTRNKHLQLFDTFNGRDIWYIPIIKKKEIPEIDYINKYGEPTYVDGFLYKTSQEFEKDINSRNIKNIEEFQTPIMTRLKDNTSILAFRCIYPININSYWGCEHGCLYCYVRFICGYYGFYTDKAVPSNFKVIKDAFHDGLHTNKDNLLSNLIRKKYPVQIGVNTDPFQECEKKHKVTYKIIELLTKEKYPFNIITKNPTLATEKEYLDLLSESSVLFHVSIPFYEEKLAKILEPNVPPPDERIKAIKKLTDNNVNVTVRVYPIMLGLNCNLDGSIIGREEYYDDFIGKLASANIDCIMTNVFRRSGFTDKLLENAVGINYKKLYEKRWVRLCGKNVASSYLEPLTYIRFCKEIRKIIVDKYKLLFSAHHCMDMSLYNLGDDVCCPTQKLPPNKKQYWNTLHGVSIPKLYHLIKEKKEVSFEDIKSKFKLENEEVIKKLWKEGFFDERFNWNMCGEKLVLEDNVSQNALDYILKNREK